MMPWLRRLALVVMLPVVTSLSPGRAFAQVLDPTLWTTDGSVSAMALDGNTLYIGGTFARIGPNTGGFATLNDATGALRAGWPRVEGLVGAVAPDGSGGCYIGGSFTSVAGVARLNLAHLRADGTLDGWNPGADGDVRALAVSGSTVYAGGDFTSIGGQARNYIAALDATSGLAMAWNPGANNVIISLAVSGDT